MNAKAFWLYFDYGEQQTAHAHFPSGALRKFIHQTSQFTDYKEIFYFTKVSMSMVKMQIEHDIVFK